MELSKQAGEFQQKLKELGSDRKVKELPDSARTAQEAAEAIGCGIAQIAKSIVFKLQQSGEPLLVIASGTNRIDEQKIEEHAGEVPGKADAKFVRAHTGYVIGGVPPMGHVEPIRTLIDSDLLQYDTIWAAAGHPKAVFELTPGELTKLTGAKVVQVCN
ncbi:YbaK/EbsC family protein [Sporosarcina gallistercoris]|uniref:YbaK/EbsC family protein n=1 Tax=Sporosarcina gallistercoris TaxID=2762245 RepID=A0ABR8PK24_9BACL|nr:YbaK/EbsC family protein [Sporosarcina gallistercoris]MBD7908528.1 YbaK/EbsC family protein [Sporosarcina gallistercoris]